MMICPTCGKQEKMIETLRSQLTEATENNRASVVNGHAAIERLITERDEALNQVGAKDAEIARLRDILSRMTVRMMLINNEENMCVINDPKICPNHSLIHEAERILAQSDEKAGKDKP